MKVTFSQSSQIYLIFGLIVGILDPFFQIDLDSFAGSGC